MKYEFEFKKKQTLQDRKKASFRVRRKFPSRSPAIVESDFFPGTNKFLTISNMRLAENMIEIRKYLQEKYPNSFSPQDYFFPQIVYNEGKKVIIPSNEKNIGELYRNYADEDGFLYIYISKESAFG